MTLTNKDIAIALGYRVLQNPTSRRWVIYNPQGMTAGSVSPIGTAEDVAERLEGAFPNFRTDLLAAFEIDDWLHGKGLHSVLIHCDDGTFKYICDRFDVKTGLKEYAGEGATRSEAIVAAFEKYKEQDIPAYREGQTK